MQFVVIPGLPRPTQTNVFLFFVALASIVGVIAAIAQISGYTLRDMHVGKTSSDTSYHETLKLIDAIRSDLYGSDSRLPGAVSQAAALCDRLGLDEYRVWIRKELAGFGNYDQPENELGTDEAVKPWIDRWASHRLIKTYFKVRFLNQRGSSEMDEWPYEHIFVSKPLQMVIEEVTGAKTNHSDELSIQLVRVDRNRLLQVRATLAEISPGMEVPSDLQLFCRLAEYEKILFGVRDEISELLTLASSKVHGSP